MGTWEHNISSHGSLIKIKIDVLFDSGAANIKKKFEEKQRGGFACPLGMFLVWPCQSELIYVVMTNSRTSRLLMYQALINHTILFCHDETDNI